MEREIISTPEAPLAGGPYSQGAKVGNLIFTAGQIGFKPGTRELIDGGIEAETRQALQNLAAILKAGGSSIDKVVKVNVFMTDLKQFQAMNKVYAEFFGAGPYPPRATVQTGLAAGALVEIEMVAMV